jgi:uncharacterized membrane protein
MKRNLLILELALIAVAIAATLLLYPHLPEQVATHWGIDGQPNGYSPRAMLWAIGPGFLALIVILNGALPWFSPRRFDVNAFRPTYDFILLAVFLMMAYCYGIILWAGVGRPVAIGRAVVGGICFFIAVIGNVLGKVRRNFYIGIRTPWTLASERVWHATHRFAAKSFVIAGIAGLAMAGLYIAPAVVIGAGALAPVLYSLVYYKRLERRGEL